MDNEYCSGVPDAASWRFGSVREENLDKVLNDKQIYTKKIESTCRS